MNYLPKIELHCHLDGSLRVETVAELAQEEGMDLGVTTIEEIRKQLVAPKACDSLLTYLTRFELPIALMQTKDRIKRVTYELMEDAASEQVKYIEIRFAPQQHLAKGLSLEDTIKAALEGIEQAEKQFEIRGNLILSYLRHTKPSGLYDLIEAGKPYLDKGVVAVDLCAGELEHFSRKFVEPIAYARTLGYQVTIHAGETGIAANVIEAIDLLKADRIGHGVAIIKDQNAFEMVRHHEITLECCPTSNVQTKAIEEMAQHPIDEFMKKQLLVTINTDNRTVSNTTMTKEFEQITEAFGWTSSHFKQIYLTSIEASYANESTKQWLRTFI